ncbi:MAG: c-type cytochrome [Acidobacteriia bacterium]|nr:c-type cytochrome [Terriglobia bacterium]
MSKNKYLLLISSLGVLLLLVAAAVQENFLREWRRVQASGRNEEGSIAVQLRQIVNPGLKTSDRCVSCHVTMAPGESTVTGSKLLTAHKPVVHDPSEWGCTVCHAGQGQATDRADAHGDVHFWPDPMIEPRFSQAGCGSCHAPLGVPEEERLSLARNTFARLDCYACHKVDGRGGMIRPDGGGMEGPDLSRVGINNYDRDWYAKHLQQHQQATQGPWRNSFAAVNDQDRALLADYLATTMAAPKLIEAKAVFNSTGCLGCHKVSGVGGDEGMDLTREGEKDPGQINFAHLAGGHTVENWMAEHFRSPVSIVVGSQMPSLGLSDREVDLLTMYMRSLRRKDLPASFTPKDRVRAVRFGEREFAGDGATLFGTFCTGCHGGNGVGRRSPGMPSFPAIASPDLLGRVSDDFLTENITKGRPGRRMPAWGELTGGLKPEEIGKIVAYLRELGVPYQPDSKPARWIKADPEQGKKLFASICSGCHGAQGQGIEGPALSNKVLLATATDSYFVQTIGQGRRGTAMLGFLEPHPARPTLSQAEIESIVAFLRTWERGKK